MTGRPGRCACGAVTVTAETPDHYGVCHCDMCRRWVGGPLMALDCGTTATFGGEVLLWDSSDWAERGSCARCGSALFYRLKETGQTYVPPGLFDDQTGLTMSEQIFVDRKPAHYDFANDTRKLTEAEVMAMVAAGQTPE